MFLLQIEITPLQAGLIFGAALGLVLGLIPLIIGIVKKQPKLGVLGLVGAIIGNTILGLLLSVPIIGICIYLILKKSSVKEPVKVVIVNETPVDVSINNSENL